MRLFETRHWAGGIQRIYKLKNGFTISIVDSPELHSYEYYSEAAVINAKGEIDETTPLSSDGIEVFFNSRQEDAFVQRAYKWAGMPVPGPMLLDGALASIVDSKTGAPVNPWDSGKPRNVPYPFCRYPHKCSGKGYCTNDPACND